MKLEIRVGEPITAVRARALEHARRVDDREPVAPLCELGFETMAQFGEVFTPKRWELTEALKTAGPLSIYALAKRLGRHYKNVHQDATALLEWMVIEKDDAGRVLVPWDEIAVIWPLTRKAA
jgi:predicted transcriptional regulator